jgi:hypothetical protein
MHTTRKNGHTRFPPQIRRTRITRISANSNSQLTDSLIQASLIVFSPRMRQDGHGYGLFTRSKRSKRREFFTANHGNGISRQNAQTGTHNSNILQPQIGADSRGFDFEPLIARIGGLPLRRGATS